MDKRRIWHWLFTALSVVGLIVMAINIGRLAEFLAVDKMLVNLASNVPDWLSRLWDTATSPTALVLSAVVVAYSAGMWTEAFFRRIAIGRNKPLDFQKFANYCEETAEIVEANFKFLRGGRDFTSLIFSRLRYIEKVFRKKLKINVQLSSKSKIDWEDTAVLLMELATPIRRGDLDAVRTVINGLKPAALEHQSPQDAEDQSPQDVEDQSSQDVEYQSPEDVEYQRSEDVEYQSPQYTDPKTSY